jgi:hypothetical protein
MTKITYPKVKAVLWIKAAGGENESSGIGEPRDIGVSRGNKKLSPAVRVSVDSPP